MGMKPGGKGGRPFFFSNGLSAFFPAFFNMFFHANSRSSGKQGVVLQGGCYLLYRKMHNISFRGKGDYRWSRNHKWGIFFGGSSSQCFLLIRSMSNAHFMLKTTVFPFLNKVSIKYTVQQCKKMFKKHLHTNEIGKSFQVLTYLSLFSCFT